ncbi:hypothetical protein P171DRAFT_446542 [Karstenula rhodostoma CBS 690.94]|uniref:Uncharacterized protein n=1 Tax=Karstenula rhodostoma CBS 690.94 TaxID=1392251 RepID=A0A9P4PEX3_9PLEO|nr:hypothetical protein P171DRAFT_446542 [Karstenula rhodostoma CBS 690.94]
MAQDSGEGARANMKRKFDIYCLDQSLVHFKIDKKVYCVDESLIEKRCGGGSWLDYIGHKENLKTTLPEANQIDGIVWAGCIGCPHDWTRQSNESLCIFRGFIYWLHEHELPSDEMIKQMDYPTQWNEIGGDKPLALAMAVELYQQAGYYKMAKLSLEMLQFIFIHFKRCSSAPQTGLLRLVCSSGEMFGEHPLERFFVDIYYKRCDEESMGLEDDYPLGFLFSVIRLKAQRNKLFAGKGKEENMVLRLSDYHINGSEVFCPTTKEETGDTWVIS